MRAWQNARLLTAHETLQTNAARLHLFCRSLVVIPSKRRKTIRVDARRLFHLLVQRKHFLIRHLSLGRRRHKRRKRRVRHHAHPALPPKAISRRPRHNISTSIVVVQVGVVTPANTHCLFDPLSVVLTEEAIDVSLKRRFKTVFFLPHLNIRLSALSSGLPSATLAPLRQHRTWGCRSKALGHHFIFLLLPEAFRQLAPPYVLSTYRNSAKAASSTASPFSIAAYFVRQANFERWEGALSVKDRGSARHLVRRSTKGVTIVGARNEYEVLRFFSVVPQWTPRAAGCMRT